MFSIRACVLPDSSLLQVYVQNGSYTDCYRAEISCSVNLSQYVNAFYTTPIFKLERLILKWMLAKPSTDTEAEQLARGQTDQFAAWRVESRTATQLLMRDFEGRTRSWLMIEPDESREHGVSYLYFGSAVTRVQHPSSGRRGLGFLFTGLLGLHKMYSRILLHSARASLLADHDPNRP